MIDCMWHGSHLRGESLGHGNSQHIQHSRHIETQQRFWKGRQAGKREGKQPRLKVLALVLAKAGTGSFKLCQDVCSWETTGSSM